MRIIMLSVVVLTKNSEKYLSAVLSSASFADEIIVLDSGSSDNTEQIAISFANVRFIRREWLGFGAMKQLGVDLAKNEWIFVLDSDEIITEPLKAEILKTLENPLFKAYKVPRLNYFFGKEIRRMGLYPDYSTRFFDRRFARFDGRVVHEKVLCDSDIGVFKEHFIHYAYESLEQFYNKQKRYASLNHRPNTLKSLLNPLWSFFKLYFLKGGFLEGKRGFEIALGYAKYTFWKYKKD